MRAHHVLFLSVGILAAANRADASTLYGSTSAGGPGELWIINQANGAAIQDVGPLNDSLGNNYAVTGLAFNPLNGVLYGSTGGKTGTELLTINPSSGLVSVVGNYNSGPGGTMSDIAFDASGNLFGISSGAGANLYSINLSTAQATKIGSSGVSFTAGGGLSIAPNGTFYGTPIQSDFGTYNPTTGAYSNIGNPARPGGSGTSYASLAFDGTTLYGMNLATPTHLVTIDLATGTTTDLGTSVPLIDGIAFQPSPVPEPGTLALFAVSGAVTLFAARRRKK